MGREDVAVCHWQGDVAEVRLHLDSKELTLRGDIRAAIGKDQIGAVSLCDDGVLLRTDMGDLLIELAADVAARWQKALVKSPPSLAQKLGVSSDMPAFVLGVVDDGVLKEALSGATCTDVATAGLLVAIIDDAAGLKKAAELACAYPTKHIWTICTKGRRARVGSTMIRTHMRELGFIDSKSCAVSDQLTATRYRLRS